MVDELVDVLELVTLVELVGVDPVELVDVLELVALVKELGELVVVDLALVEELVEELVDVLLVD
eukprot:1635528-Amphidinium_carterae.2